MPETPHDHLADPPSPAVRGPRQAAIAFILITVILDVLSLGLIIPVLQKLIQELVGGDETQAWYYVGWFGTLWALMQFFFSPISGALSDRFGRRPVLLVSTFGLGLDFVLLALAPNLAWLLVGRIITGMTAASFSTAQAYLADVSTPENRTAAYGMFGAAFGLGFILGPIVGGLLGDIDLRLPFWVSAALTLTNGIYGFFVLPESLPPEKRSPFRWSRANPLGSLRLLLSVQGLLPMAVILFFYQLSHLAFQNVFVLYTGKHFLWTPKQVGLALGTVGILNFIVQGGLIRPAIKRFGERILVFVGLLGGIAGFTSYAIARDGTTFYYCTILFALMGFFQASINGVMSTRLGPKEQGRLSGANSSMMGIAGLIGPSLYATVSAWSVQPGRSEFWQGTPFAMAAGILMIALVIAFFVVPKRSTTSVGSH
jgi:DHA1 family tetracycline resistance protein-like MFS transporter